MTKDKYPWRTIFLELALRAVIEVHHKNNVWEIRQSNQTFSDFTKLNKGDGIFYAPEEHVRDAMALQIIETGIWKKSLMEGEWRSYAIDTEFSITMRKQALKNLDNNDKILSDFFGHLLEEDSTEKLDTKKDEKSTKKQDYKSVAVDIVFKRLEPETAKGEETIPVLIEAKRYQLKSIRLSAEAGNGKLEPAQIKDIAEDIDKLYCIYNYVISGNKITVFGTECNSFYPYLLVWGKLKKNDKLDLPELFKKGSQ